MKELTKAQRELKQAAEKLTAYMDHVQRGIAEFDAKNPAVLQTEDAIRQVQFQARGGIDIRAEGADALTA